MRHREIFEQRITDPNVSESGKRSSDPGPSQFRIAAFLILASLLFGSQSLFSQMEPTSPLRNPAAVALLTQALRAAGGSALINSIQDFSGSGNITYSWAGQEVDGTATIRALGNSMFRMDAQLPDGLRSWVATDTGGGVKSFDGTTLPIQYSNAVSLGGLTCPYSRIAAALASPSFSIVSAGTTTIDGVQGTVIQVKQIFPKAEDPTGDVAKLNTQSYIFNAQTLALIETTNTLWSDDGRMLPVVHEVLFSDFHVITGISVPFSISERIGGQVTWSLQLNSLTFNTGLTPDNFLL